MDKEYEIRVLLNPKNRIEPYFWVIIKWHKDSWTNTGTCGWEETPQKCWDKAYEEYQKLY